MLQNGLAGGKVSFYPYKSVGVEGWGGRGKGEVYAMLKGGGGATSFEVVLAREN